MLQQTQVKTVIPYWERWLGDLPTIESLAKAKQEKIHKLWEGLGYYTRVRNLQNAAQQIVEKHGGKFPKHFDDVLDLPGIGRYTAGAICSIAFNQPTPILDGNVIRVLTRVFGILGNPKEKKTNAQLWQLAEQLVVCAAPQPNDQSHTPRASHLNQSLMELGALICTPRSPKCDVCPVKNLCVALNKNCVEALPNLGKRGTATERHFIAFVIERDGKFLVRQRPPGVVNAHLWEFPNVEGKSTNTNTPFQLPKNDKPFCRIKHSITRYRITLDVYRTPLPGAGIAGLENSKRRVTPPSETDGVWRTLAKLHQLAFTSAHRKILAKLGE